MVGNHLKFEFGSFIPFSCNFLGCHEVIMVGNHLKFEFRQIGVLIYLEHTVGNR
jgi:hypothetical protein